MSGQHPDLISLVCGELDSQYREAMRLFMHFVLRHQYIIKDEADVEDGVIWRVIIGSGMGLLCSPEVSNLAFYALAEKPWALVPAVASRFQMAYYGRFMDDIIVIIAGDPASRVQWATEYKHRSSFFRITCDSVSIDTAVMLDLVLFKGPHWHHSGLLDYKVHIKSTSIWTPLSVRSAHHPNIHLSWPRSQLARLGRRCSSKRDAILAKQDFCDRMLETSGRHIDSSFSSHAHSSQPDTFSRIVLPFSTVLLQARIPSVLASVAAGWAIPSPWSNMSVAWRLGGRHLVHKLASLSTHWHSERHSSAFIVH